MMEDYLISKLEVLGDSDHNLTSNAIYLIYKIRPYILNISLERNYVSVDFELTNNNQISLHADYYIYFNIGGEEGVSIEFNEKNLDDIKTLLQKNI